MTQPPPAGPPPYGPPPGQSPYGQAHYGPPQYGPPQSGQPQYGPPQYAAPYYPPPQRRRAPAQPGPGWALAAAGAAGAVGSVLPWATLGPFTKDGLDGDGALTIGLMIAVAIGGVWTALRAPLGIPITALVLSLIAALIAVIDIADVSGSQVDVGIGLWLTGAAAAVGSAAGIWALVARPQARAAQAGPPAFYR